MAIDHNFTGFEGGARDPFASLSGLLWMCDGRARTGEWYATTTIVTATTNDGRAAFATPTAGQSIANDAAAFGQVRVWFRLRTIPSGATDIKMFGWGSTGAAQQNGAGLLIKSTGAVACASSTTVGAYSTELLTTGLWYRAEMVHLVKNPAAGSSTTETTISIYNEAGALIVTVTASGTAAATPSIPAASIGHVDANSSTFLVDYDDWIWQVDDGLAIGSVIGTPPAFTTATRITRVDATAQGANAGWSGDFRTVTDVPRDVTAGDEQTVTTDEATTTFTHATAQTLGLSGIVAIKITGALKATSGGADALMINGVEYAVTTPTAYAAIPLTRMDWNAYTSGQFDAMEFGARNKRGISLQLGQCYLEVLHAGDDPFKSVIAGTASWKHRIIQWTGDGAFRTISGVGFRSQVIVAKKVGATSSAGTLKLGCMGGTVSKPLDQAALDSRAIMTITDDGFTLGPDAHTNAAGVEYAAICIQDGGEHASGYFLQSGAFPGTGEDNHDITVLAAWQPDFVFTASSTVARSRTSDHAGDSSNPLSASATVTDQIQAINSDGFQIGTAVNSNAAYQPYFAIRRGADGVLDEFFRFGSFLGSGTSEVVSVGTLVPVFVTAKRIAAVDAQWRSTLVAAHSAALSTVWLGSGTNSTGITAIGSGSFTLGSSLSQAATTTHWFAFNLSGEVATATDLPPFWENPDLYGGLPPMRCLIMIPSTGTNFSREKTVTMLSGTPLPNYPASNLTDDTVQTALRVSETAIDFYIDLGSAKTPDGVAILNHNFDPGVILQVFFSDLITFATGEQIGVTVVRPNMWIDLRNFPVTRRYVRIRTSLTVPNSKAISISQVVVASMEELHGVIEAESLEQSQKFWTAREFTEEMLPYRMASGIFTRTVDLSLEMDVTSRDVLHAVFEDAGMTGYRVLFIPNSRKNDAYWIDWPDRRSTNFPESDRVTKMRLTLVEETPGVVN